MTSKLAITLLALLVTAPAAHASVVGLDSLDGTSLVYAADPGEQNRLTVSRQGNRIVFEDPGATISPGAGCEPFGGGRVRCNEQRFISVRLEDGDDEATSSGDVTGGAGGPEITFHGQQGRDTLRGSADSTSLLGGPEEDILVGGTGTDFINAVDIIWIGEFTRMPITTPAVDQITCVERPAGAAATSIDRDEGDTTSGPCGLTALYRGDHILVRGTDGDDQLFGHGPPTRIEALAGNDAISLTSTTRAFGGLGDDTLNGGGVGFGGPGNDRLDAGAGTTGGGQFAGGSGDDFVAGSNSRDLLIGGGGADRLSARGGRDIIRARDRFRDVVRCGAGRDLVFIDRRDQVAGDCERVRRSVATAGVDARTSARRSCARRARGHNVVARSGNAIVWERGFYLYGCLGSVRKAFRLPNEGGGYDTTGESSPKIAGQYVAYATLGSAVGDEFDRVYEVDLRTGRTVIRVSSNGNVSDIVAKPNGSIAWIENGPVSPGTGSPSWYDVRKIGEEERVGAVLLDRGTAVDPDSLVLSADGATLTWTKGAEQRSAPIR